MNTTHAPRHGQQGTQSVSVAREKDDPAIPATRYVDRDAGICTASMPSTPAPTAANSSSAAFISDSQPCFDIRRSRHERDTLTLGNALEASKLSGELLRVELRSLLKALLAGRDPLVKRYSISRLELRRVEFLIDRAKSAAAQRNLCWRKLMKFAGKQSSETQAQLLGRINRFALSRCQKKIEALGSIIGLLSHQYREPNYEAAAILNNPRHPLARLFRSLRKDMLLLVQARKSINETVAALVHEKEVNKVQSTNKHHRLPPVKAA